jgi:hypothetical protein
VPSQEPAALHYDLCARFPPLRRRCSRVRTTTFAALLSRHNLAAWGTIGWNVAIWFEGSYEIS